MDVVRDEVNITTVRGAFMIDNETGYVKLAEFSETSDRELGAALQQLAAKGMKRLAVRSARQSRRPARPGDPRRRIASCRRVT